MKTLKRLLMASLLTISVVCLLLGTSSVRILADSARTSLPTELLATIPKTTTLTDRHGKVLYYYYTDRNNLIAKPDAIPQTMKEAIIAAEDERFYLHRGFDLLSVVRAVRANWERKSIVSGGSTLTMQLVKNITGDSRRSWQRKLKEAYLATVIESQYSKDQILTAYLNLVPLGHNLAGVETASRFYFDKPVAELTLAESATLAALPTAPEYYAMHPEALEKRRNYVLRRMIETDQLTKTEAEVAMATKSPIKAPIIPLQAPHFVATVIDELKATYGQRLTTQGLTVTTTLDLTVQEQAERAVRANRSVLGSVGASNVGLVSIEPQTGAVLAMVGSVDFNNKSNRGEVNFTTANLSYGSTLKPLLYAFLLEKEHWSPGAIMWDVKTEFPIQGERQPYTPKNYDGQYFGPMTLRQALANSRNVTAIKALEMVGLKTTLERLQELGITSLGTDTSQYGPSLAVGGGGVPLLQLTGAYTALANEGRVNQPQLIQQTDDYAGQTIQRLKPTNRLVIKPEVAYEIAEILQDNEARKRVFGASSPLVIKGETVAAKTGTAEDYRSALTIGFTPEVVTGVIVANNNNEPLRAGGSGAMAAAPFFHRFMTDYLADKPNQWFSRPSTVTTTEFPTVIGKVSDLVAPWQSPAEHFNRRVAEFDNPLWNLAITRSAKPPTDVAVKAEDRLRGGRE